MVARDAELVGRERVSIDMILKFANSDTVHFWASRNTKLSVRYVLHGFLKLTIYKWMLKWTKLVSLRQTPESTSPQNTCHCVSLS